MSEYGMLKKVGILALTIVGAGMAFKAYFDSREYPKYPVNFPENPDDEESLVDDCEDDDDETDDWATKILDAAAEAAQSND